MDSGIARVRRCKCGFYPASECIRGKRGSGQDWNSMPDRPGLQHSHDAPTNYLSFPATATACSTCTLPPQSQAEQSADPADTSSDAVTLPQEETAHPTADVNMASELEHWQATSVMAQPTAEAALVMQGTFEVFVSSTGFSWESQNFKVWVFLLRRWVWTQW